MGGPRAMPVLLFAVHMGDPGCQLNKVTGQKTEVRLWALRDATCSENENTEGMHG
jgi:hypothetical protein